MSDLRGPAPPRAGTIVLLSAIAAVACATSTPGPSPRGEPGAVSSEHRHQLEQLRAAIDADARALDAAHAGAAPDCARACGLAGNICVMAQRICAIAARYPADDPVAASCTDARARCQRARQSAGERCPCRDDR